VDNVQKKPWGGSWRIQVQWVCAGVACRSLSRIPQDSFAARTSVLL